jgi:hypothetical protein
VPQGTLLAALGVVIYEGLRQFAEVNGWSDVFWFLLTSLIGAPVWIVEVMKMKILGKGILALFYVMIEMVDE